MTTVGTGVDNAVLRIANTYEVRGSAEKITSYDNATVGSGSVVNEVLLEYADSGLLSKEYQEHDGAKDGSTPYVGYNYDTTASGGQFTKGLRPTSVRYPNGRLVHNTYGSSGSTADALNRLDAINDDNSGSPGDALAQYSYLGAGTIVVEDYVEPDVKLDYVGDGSYSGFDRFGRVVDQKWYEYGAAEVRDQYTYDYDRAGNRLYRENTTTTGKDEYYTYDGINRLVNFDRGDLNAGKTAISGTPVREEDWSLDPTGNWTDYVQKTSGATDLDQDRTHNKVNEITAITAAVGTDWTDPVHDRAGNMTTLPKPSSPTDGLTCQYDSWNRLVQVKGGQTVVGKYEYDGLNRRIKKHYDSGAPDNPTGIDQYTHYFYNRSWQILETRDTTTESDQPENLQPKYQHLWSPRYIDAPILRDENTDQDNLCDDERLYYLGDANFNVTTLVDVNGDAVERYEYGPYGKVTIYDGTWSTTRSTSSFANNVLYTGRELDSESGIMHYRNRYYSVDLGRFVCRDPIGYSAGDTNLYRYVGNTPILGRDPFGLAWAWWDFVWHYYHGEGEGVDLADIGLLETFKNAPDVQRSTQAFKAIVAAKARQTALGLDCTKGRASSSFFLNDTDITDVTGQIFSVGHSTFYRTALCSVTVPSCKCCKKGTMIRVHHICVLSFGISDAFKDPLDVGIEPGGTPYKIDGGWAELFIGFGEIPCK